MQIFKAFNNILRSFSDTYLLPRTCAVCGRTLAHDEEVLCLQCLIELPVCRERGVTLINNREALMNAVQPLSLVEVFMRYDPLSPYATLIRGAKYNDRPLQAYNLGRIFARELLARPYHTGHLTPEKIDVLLPIPMYRTKQLRRGYNQSAEIARGIADVLGCEVADNLVAVRPHSTQTRLSYRKRAENIKGCFELRHPNELKGLNIAVVDDIITTGASMGEALIAISWGAPDIASASLLALGATIPK